MKVLKDSDTVMRQRMISGCSVQFDRLYIEVDEEVISTITDVEGKLQNFMSSKYLIESLNAMKYFKVSTK